MNTEIKPCKATIEFQSTKTIKLKDGEIAAKQGRIKCTYPNGPCELRSRQATGNICRVTKGRCAFES